MVSQVYNCPFERPHKPLSAWLLGLDKKNRLPNVMVYEVDIDDSEAQERETWWIKLFRPLGLLNLNDGTGPGPNARTSELNRQKTIARNRMGWSESTRAKQIAIRTGKKWDDERKQKHRSLASVKGALEKLRNRNRESGFFFRKPIRCVETGEVFDSLVCCVRKNGFNQPWFSNQMRLGRPYRGLHYEHIQKD